MGREWPRVDELNGEQDDDEGGEVHAVHSGTLSLLWLHGVLYRKGRSEEGTELPWLRSWFAGFQRTAGRQSSAPKNDKVSQ